MSGPWTFEQAQLANREAAALQAGSETAIKDAFRAAGEAENAYRQAHAEALVRARASGDPVSVCEAVAKADPRVCELRLARDVAEGVKKAAEQEAWRRSADRRIAEGFLNWSMRRELSEHGQPDDRLSWARQGLAA